MANNNLYLNVPAKDMDFITMLVEKMGWSMETNLSLLDKFIKTRPEDADITDDEIMDEVRAVRYE